MSLASRTKALELKVVAGDDIAVLLGDSVDELFELGRIDGDELVAAGAL